MAVDENEEKRLRAAAFKNVESILIARQRAERELLAAKEALELKTQELLQQRQWFEVTLSSIADAVITTDTLGNVTFLNPVAESMTGWTAAEAKGEPLTRIFRIVHEDTHEPADNPVTKVLRDGCVVALANHTALIRKDGELLAIEDSAAPIKDMAGNISGAVMVFHDVTARRRTERSLREARARLEVTLNAAEIGTWTWNIRENRLVADRNLARLFSLSPENAAGAPLEHYLSAVHPDDLARVQAAISEALTGESGSYEVDYRVMQSDGSHRWVVARGKVERSDDGSPIELPSVIIDITERKRAEEESFRAEELRSRLAAIVESSDDAIISKTLEGVIVTWNQSATRMFGYEPSEIIGQPVTVLISPEHIDEEPAILERLQNGQLIEHYETVRKKKDGTLIDVSLSVSPIRDANNKIIGASKIARDITRQKRTEEALQASDARFQLMANSAPVLIWISDATKASTWFNKTWFEFTGRTLEEEIGFGWAQNVNLEDLDSCMQIYTASFEARQPFRREYRLGRHDGEWRWVIDTAVPLFEGPNGTFSGYIGSCIDITEFRHAASEREQLLHSERLARNEAERLGRMKDEFLATLSHELRTPLNAILGWATLLRRLDAGSIDHLKGLETIERNARAQAQIIGDLLDMSRIISGKVQLDVQPVNLHEVISAGLDAVRPSAEAKRLSIRTTLDSKVGLVRGDANRLQQVLWNLLTNAVKFTPAGGRVDILLERVNSHVEISVEDSGIGIKPEFLAFVFDRFRQADASITRRHGGLGLGLSIVKHLVELHGGSVRVKSPGEGQGSTFIVALPISAARSDDSAHHERPAFAEIDLFSVALPSLAGISVLIVDDEPDARALVGRLVEERGASAVVTSSAPEALEALAKQRVDILVSDIGMPDFDGYELIQRIRAFEKHPLRNLPAIALTAYARSDDRQRALLAGYQMHLAKPIEPRELIAGIASLLNIPQRLSAPPSK